MVDNCSIRDKIEFFENSSSKNLGNFLLENLDILEEDIFYKDFFINKLAEVIDTLDRNQTFYFLNWLFFDSKFSDDVIYVNDIFERIKDIEHIKNYILEYFNNISVDDLSLLFNLVEFDDQANTFFSWLMECAINNNKEDIIFEYFNYLLDFDNNNYYSPAKFICMCDKLDFVFCPEYFIDFIISFAENGTLEQYPDLINYLNNAVFDDSGIANKIMSCEKLVDYVIDGLDFLNEWKYNLEDIDKLTEDDLYKIYFDNNDPNYVSDEIFCKKLCAEKIIYFTGFNELIANYNTRDKILKIIPLYLEKFTTYERAIFIVDLLDISDNQKEYIIKRAYPNNNHTVIKKVKNDIIKRNFDKVLKNEIPVDDEFKNLLPELVGLSFDEEFFLKIKDKCLNIQSFEYLQVFLSQLIKYIAINRDISLNLVSFYKGENSMSSQFGFCEGGSYTLNSHSVWINYNMYGNQITPEVVTLFIISVLHEMRHAFQFQKCDEEISIDSLLLNIQKILTYGFQPDQFAALDYYIEIDARNYSIYDTFRFLEEISPINKNTISKDNKYVFSLTQLNYLNFLKYIPSFLEDRNTARSLEYFCNLLNSFKSEISKEAIIEFRKKFKVIELITNNDGRLYSSSEIQEIIDSIKSYSTNDIKYDNNLRNIRVFYMRYLSLLNKGISYGYINFESKKSLKCNRLTKNN